MNDTFKELKERVRRLDALLADRGAGNLDFAQALSRVHRLEKKGDRSREPSPELRALLERAEGLGRKIA
ncbi:MAG TPA: hypothetical protein VF894_11655 [Anaeromyxobacter sp.]